MKLFKRNPENPNCAWSVRFSVRNRIYPFSTQTTDKALALVRAKDYRNKIVAGAYGMADSMRSRSGTPTLASLVAIYDTLPAPVAHTKKRNVSALKAVLAASGLDLAARVDRLGAHIVTAYQSAMLKAHPGSNSAMVSANSNVRMARSVLSKAALLSYRATLTIPQEPIDGFFAARFLKCSRPLKQLPSEDAVKAVVEKLKEKPDFYRAFLLAAVAGCRAGEIKEARRSWLTGTTLRIGAFPDEFRTKSGQERNVNLPQEAVEILLAGDDPVYLVGPRRNQIVSVELNAFLKDNGFAGIDKPIQSMRRRLGSLIYSNQSAAIAKETLGHGSIAVLEQFYASSMNKQAPVAMPG